MAPELEDSSSSLGFIIYWLWDDGRNGLEFPRPGSGLKIIPSFSIDGHIGGLRLAYPLVSAEQKRVNSHVLNSVTYIVHRDSKHQSAFCGVSWQFITLRNSRSIFSY